MPDGESSNTIPEGFSQLEVGIECALPIMRANDAVKKKAGRIARRA